MRIGEIDKLKQIELQTIEPSRTVHEAIKQLVQYNIGALPVCNAEGTLVGILSERDVLRLAARDDCEVAMARRVEEVMTSDLIVAVPDDSIDYAMRVMTDRRIRHLPILEDGSIIGILSIGDVVKAKQDEAETQIRYLRDYVSGATA